MRSRTFDRKKARGTCAPCIQPLEARVLLSLDNFGSVRADGNDITFDLHGQVHRVWRDTDTGQLFYAKRTGPHKVWGPSSLVDPRRAGG
ncbi:MAG: hypothetical protein NZ561_05455, partial [Phycisphaerae bacterium]|nr:hypothetical protein [Phycisphaerae bacterium]